MPDPLLRDAKKLALETGADIRTAHRWLSGERVQGSTEYALRTAADKLGISPPTTDTDATAGAA